MRVCLLLFCTLLWAQDRGDLAEGKAVFRSNCAFCHGVTGAGGRGPALDTGRFLHGGSDADLTAVIQKGVSGSTMPGFASITGSELKNLLLFIRSLSGGDRPATPLDGDPVKGKQLYARNGCAGCHQIAGQGSLYGPDLTRAGAGRSRAYLIESLLKPSSDILPDFEGVSVTARDGKKVSGVRINEDTFTVQLRDLSQQFRMFRKQDVQRVERLTESLMPAYKLQGADLKNLVAYLETLRGDLKSGTDAQKAKGIH